MKPEVGTSPEAGSPEAASVAAASAAGAGASAPGGVAPGSVTRGAFYGMCTQAMDKILPVALLLYLARVFEPATFGIYSFVVAYLSIFQILAEHSVDTILVRAMSQTPGERAQLLRAGLGLKLVLAVGSAVVAVALVSPLSAGEVGPGLMALAALSLPTALGGAYRAYFRSVLQIRALFFIAATRAGLLLTAVVLAVAFGGGLRSIFAAMAVANLATILVVSWAMRGLVRPWPSVDVPRWRRLLRGTLPLVTNALAMTVMLRTGHVMLMSMRGPVEVGLLNAASRITEAFTLLPEALMIAILPLMAGQHARGPEAALPTARRAARYLVVVAGIPVILCVSAGGFFMELLFGEAFVEASPVLATLSFTALLAATGTVIMNLLVAAHQERTLAVINVAVAFANIGLSWVWIGSAGKLGAAGALLASGLTGQVLLALLPATGRYVRPLLWTSVPVLGALTVALLVSDQIPRHMLGVAAAGGAYAAALLLFGVIRRDDLDFLRSSLRVVRKGPRTTPD